MPFVCKYQLNNEAITNDDRSVFKRYLDESFGKYYKEPIKIAEALPTISQRLFTVIVQDSLQQKEI